MAVYVRSTLNEELKRQNEVKMPDYELHYYGTVLICLPSVYSL